MKKNIFLFIVLLCFFFNCASQDPSSFLYKGNFFKKGISAVNYPYQLTTDLASEFSPAISPNGKYIIYVSDKRGNLDLWLYDILNRESFPVTYHTSDDTMPSFAENGKEIIFISFRQNGLGDIYKMDFADIMERCRPGLSGDYIKELLKDDGAEPVTLNRAAESEPVYIDSKYLLYVRPDKKGLKNIFKTKDKLNADTEQITSPGAISPALSPDKKSLAYVDVSADPVHHGHIFILDLSSRRKKQVTFGRSIETRPNFINNRLLLYSSTRFDINKDGHIDINDNAGLYIYDLAARTEKQLTPDNYTGYYPLYSNIYGGVIIFTSSILDNIGLWMLSIEGYLPELENSGRQLKFIESLDDNYLMLMGYKNLLNKKGVNRASLNIKIADIYFRMKYPELSATYLSNAVHNARSWTPEQAQARLSVIRNSSTNKRENIKQIESLKKDIGTNQSLLPLINFELSKIYIKLNEYKNALPLLEGIAASYTNKDIFFFNSLRELALITLQASQYPKAVKYALLLNTYPDPAAKAGFIKEFLDLYLRYSASMDPDLIYKELLDKFKGYNDFTGEILYRYALSLKDPKEAARRLNLIVSDPANPSLKIKVLEQLYLITKDENYLIRLISIPAPDIEEAKEIITRSENILINKNLTTAWENFNYEQYLPAREYFQKALQIDNNNTGALVGNVRCELKLMTEDEKKYRQLIEKYDLLLQNDPYNYVYHYIKGYACTLIYSLYHLKYKLSLKQGEPSFFGKIFKIFTSHPRYPSYYMKRAREYFMLSEENLKITYRIKPDFIPAYLTSGWLYQVHALIDRERAEEYIENAVPLYQSAIHFNDEEKDAVQESFLCLNLANIYFNLNNYSQAVQFYNKKLEYSPAFESKLQEAYFYYHLGYACWFLGNDEPANQNFQKCYDNFMNLKEYHGAYRCLIFMAMISRINENFKKALDYYNRALNIIEEYKIEFNKERLIRELGICMNNTGDPQAAMNYFNTAANILPEEKKPGWLKAWINRPGIRLHLIDDLAFTVWGASFSLGKSFAARGFNNRDEKKLLYALISDTYNQFMNFEKALEYLLLKRKLLDEDKNNDALPYVNNNLGILYFKLNDLTSSRAYFSESIKLLEKDTKKDEQGNKIPNDMYGIAVNHLNLIEVLLKQYHDSAVDKYLIELSGLLDKCIQISRDNKYYGILARANNLYGVLHFKKAIQNPGHELNINNAYDSIRESYKDFLTSMKYYETAKQFASQKKQDKDIYYIDFNRALIYYYTKDFRSALETFEQVKSDAGKFILPDLKWKCRYYILKIKQILSEKQEPDNNYASIIHQIEELPKGYDYNPNEEPVIDNIYNEYINELIGKNNYIEALKYMEKKKNFAIKEIFLSYPFELRKNDKDMLKNIKDMENSIIIKLTHAQKELFNRFDIKKRDDFEKQIEKLYTERSNLLSTVILNNPELAYYAYKNELPLQERIKNMSGKNGILVLNLYKTNLNLCIITNSTVTFKSIRLDRESFLPAMARLNNKLDGGEDVKAEFDYFENYFIRALRRIFSNKEIITIIPDDILFAFPFHLFLKEKKINYDISLAQFFFNFEKIPLTHLKTAVFNADSKLNKLPFDKNPFPEKEIPIPILNRIFTGSSVIHITDGLQFSPSLPVYYRLNYNKDHTVEINRLLQDRFKGELISYENPAENFVMNEKNIYSLLLPAYYSGAPGVSFNLWPIKEKINFNFWDHFYSIKGRKLIDKFYSAGDMLYRENNSLSLSFFKVLYGNFGMDQSYKIDALGKKLISLQEKIRTETGITNKIEYYNSLLQAAEELQTLQTNILFPSKGLYTNLIALYIKNNDYQNALKNLNTVISGETNLKEKIKFQSFYTNVLVHSRMTNNNSELLLSFIGTGDAFFTNEKYKKAADEYNKAMDYLENSFFTNYKKIVIHKLALSLIAGDELEQAKTLINKGLALASHEKNKEFRDKFYILSAKIDFLNKNYPGVISLITNINNKNEDYYMIKIQSLLKTDMPESTKYSQVNLLVSTNIRHLSKASLKKIFNPVIDYFIDREAGVYHFINIYKNIIYGSSMDIPTIRQSFLSNSLFIDFYVSDENIYSFLLTKTNTVKKEIKLEKFNSLFKEYYESIEANNEENFNDAGNSLFEILFENIQDSINLSTNIIICPDEALFFINYYELANNLFSASNRQVKIIRAYSSLTNTKKQPFIFQAFGIQKNPGGRVVDDFSYKEVKELKYNFKNSSVEINPQEIRLNSSMNSLHLAMPVIFTKTNIILYDENNDKKYFLTDLLENRSLSLMLLTKTSWQEYNNGPLTGLYTDNLMLSLWRNNDALSAVFIRNFYSYLSLCQSVDKAFIMTLRKMSNLYQNHLQWNNFTLIR